MKPGALPSWTEVRAIEAHLCSTFGVRVVAKADDPFMRLIALGLDALESTPVGRALPMTGKDFLGQWATTIGKTVYMPVVQDTQNYLCLLGHEMGHAIDYSGESGDGTSGSDPYRMPTGLAFVQLYLTGDLHDLRTMREFCAHAEAHAEAIRCEMYRLLTGELMATEEALVPLHGPAYLLRDSDVDLAHGILASRLTSVRYGVYLSPVTRAVQTYCMAHLSHVLAA